MPLPDAIDSPMHTRPCAVAGRFYPSDPQALSRDIERYLADAGLRANENNDEQHPLRAIIAPHAGYIYSAPIAASAYRQVAMMRESIRRVVLIGPAHYVPLSGLGCSSASAFQTPFGDVPVDTDAVKQLLSSEHIHLHDEAHAPEHGLEVHLPLLIHTLMKHPGREGATFSIVPILFGDVSYQVAADVLDAFLDDPHTLVVVSSDLSHYQSYEQAQEIDRATADAIVAGRLDAVTPDRACGHTAVRALMSCATRRSMRITEVDLRSSGDTAGPRDRVVGYGAFVVRG